MEEPKTEPRMKRAWAYIAAWIAGIMAVLGFIGTLTGTFTNLWNHFHQGAELKAQMKLAQSQVSQGEYSEADQTYTALLQSHPHYLPSLHGRLAATEQWVENFHVFEQDGRSTTATAASLLDQIFPILDRALVDAKGAERSDVQAHLGWAHWLNRHIAMREFGPLAEQDLRAAFASDPRNVYANSMLDNWLLQNHGELSDALQHFDTAISTGKERPFVRRLQVAGLTRLEIPGARRALYQALNDMRRSAESLPAGSARNALEFCCFPGFTTDDKLGESLTAVPREDAWQTYKWLESGLNEDGSGKQLRREFVQARLAEIAGEHDSALAQFRTLQAKLKNGSFTMREDVARSILRLSAAPKRR